MLDTYDDGGSSGATVSSSVAATANPTNEGQDGGASPCGFPGEQRAIDRRSAGHRWHREETLALLKIRSDMDASFRNSSPQAPLWDVVSRKLSELGYQKNAKKCREKFENIYKYNKRTKECGFGRQPGKKYRYCEQLQLLDNHSSLPSPSQHKPHLTGTTMIPQTAMTTTPTSLKPSSLPRDVETPFSVPSPSTMSMAPPSTSSMSSLGKENERNGKKRKLDDYFERLVKEVLERQEDLQNKFIEALERCENDRMVREQAWRSQESAMLKREQDMLATERSISAARDAAVIAFLQKFSAKEGDSKFPDIPTCVPPQVPIPNPSKRSGDRQENGNPKRSMPVTSCSRWPKEEVLALINVRTEFDLQYQDNGSKGPLWEEISLLMKKLGYDRSAKRCKEKWENMNKYFRRVKESDKERSGDSKTCPYFKQLESLYGSKAKKADAWVASVCNLKPKDLLEQLTTPSPPPPQQQKQQLQEQSPESVREEEEDGGDYNGEKYQVVTSNATLVSKWDGETMCRSFSINS